MATEYKLSYTGAEINEKLSKVDTIWTNINTLSEEIANYLPKNQGSANVGKILVVGTDGNLVLTDMPEGGTSGDVIGTFDENNNILLQGNIAVGTYTLAYVDEEGNLTGAGSLVVSAIEPEEPDTPAYTNILTSGDYEIHLNKRWTKSGKKLTDCNGMLTMFIPIANVWNKRIWFKGFENNMLPGERVPFWCMNAEDGTEICTNNIGEGNNSSVFYTKDIINEGNGVYSVGVNTINFNYTDAVVTLVVQQALNSTGDAITALADDMIMTIDEEIV